MTRRFFLLFSVLVGACARGEITLPAQSPAALLTVDASTAFTYVDLAAGAVVPQASPSTATTWDIGFNGTSVVLNGGSNGPGGVTAICLCQNAGATSDRILAFTAEGQASPFESVSAADIPPNASWSADVFATSRWYRYNLAGDNRISPTFDVYLIRRGASVYKIQLIDYYGPAGESRRISFRYAKVS